MSEAAVAEPEAVKGAAGIGDVLTHMESQPEVSRPERNAEADDRSEAREETEDRLQSMYREEPGDKAEQPPAEDQTQPAKPAAVKPEAKPAAAAKPESTNLWSNEDVELFSQIQTESRAFQSDLQQFAQVKLQFQQLAQSDPEKAKALAPRIQAAERDLRARYGSLQQGAQYVMGRLQHHHQTQTQAHLMSENEKLEAAFPNLDRSALAGYLSKLGFSPEQIGTTDDHRLLAMAEKARRYDAQQRGRKLKIPTRKRAPAAPGKPKLVAESGNVLTDIQRKHYDPKQDGAPSVGRRANGFQKRAALDSMYPQQGAPALLMPEKPPAERLRLLYASR